MDIGGERSARGLRWDEVYVCYILVFDYYGVRFTSYGFNKIWFIGRKGREIKGGTMGKNKLHRPKTCRGAIVRLVFLFH